MFIFHALIIDYSKIFLRVLLKLRKAYISTNKIDYMLSYSNQTTKKHILWFDQ